ncbi:MAG: P-type conjugative transfer ATPase TrbB [Acidiferrobacterales bacterium]
MSTGNPEMEHGVTAVQAGRARQLEALRRNLGSEVLRWLEESSVVEVMLNPNGELWVERLGEGMAQEGQMDAVQALALIQSVAALRDSVVTPEAPILECELPLDGSRFEALVPPLTEHPVFTLRKRALRIFTLADYVDQGVLTPGHRDVLQEAVRQRQNILVSGGTGSGKSTLLNALLHAVSQETPGHRLVVIEDTRELQCTAPNAVFLRTSESIDMTRLLRATLRLRPDRIIVGEVRGAEALALLKAWNTGHPGGVGTVHANDALGALIRLGQMIQEAGVPPQPELIAQAVQVVVNIRRLNEGPGRKVEEIVRVAGYGQGRFHVEVEQTQRVF